MTDSLCFVCDVCDRPYRHGPHRYEGHALKRYGDIFACDVCWNGNHDGWAPQYEARLKAHLERQGLPEPERNRANLLPRE